MACVCCVESGSYEVAQQVNMDKSVSISARQNLGLTHICTERMVSFLTLEVFFTSYPNKNIKWRIIRVQNIHIQGAPKNRKNGITVQTYEHFTQERNIDLVEAHIEINKEFLKEIT
jgi:hypothetical protein